MGGTTYIVVTAVHAQLRSCRNSAAEPEKRVQDIQNEREHGVDLQAILDARRNEVEEREHREDGAE